MPLVGWHSYAIDNEVRAAARLAGAESLGVEMPTSFEVQGATVVGTWLQTPPEDLSDRELEAELTERGLVGELLSHEGQLIRLEEEARQEIQEEIHSRRAELLEDPKRFAAELRAIIARHVTSLRGSVEGQAARGSPRGGERT